MSVQLFNSTLSGTFQPTKPLLLSSDVLALAFKLIAAGGTAAAINFYLEFTDGDPNNSATDWFREVDEQDTGNGVITMAAVVRTFQVSGGGNLPAGAYKFSTQFTRLAQFARVQIQISAGAATAQITAPFGSAPVS